MIEETARVVALEDDFAWVETQRKSTVARLCGQQGLRHRDATMQKRLPRTRAINPSSSDV
jgi:positive regulator of sigma E activity